MSNEVSGSIIHNGAKYSYIRALAKNGDICLATKDPLKYCNGTYPYSSKDPGSGVEYVVINDAMDKSKQNL